MGFQLDLRDRLRVWGTLKFFGELFIVILRVAIRRRRRDFEKGHMQFYEIWNPVVMPLWFLKLLEITHIDGRSIGKTPILQHNSKVIIIAKLGS